MAINLLEDEMPANKPAPINLLEDEMPQAKENFATSAGMAIPRIVKDIGGSALGFLRNIPNYLSEGKTEVPGLFDSYTKHPAHVSSQIKGGLFESLLNAINIPHDVQAYTEKRLHLLPEGYSNNNFTPNISSQNIETGTNALFGEKQYPGESLARGIGRNLALGTAAARTALKFNPAQLSSQNIAKGIVDTEKGMKEKYSGETGLYNQLSDEATSRGITLSHINPEHINSSSIDLPSLDKFIANKNLLNAQRAISDLGFRERLLGRKQVAGTLDSEGRDKLKEATNAKNYIQNNMFKDEEGNVHQDLLDKHREIQKGYANEVIPYTKNKAIQDYKKQEKLPSELVQSLSKGKFAAKRGEFHPEFERQALVKGLIKHLGMPALHGSALGAGGLGIYELLKGNNND
jgi:hypothetical protein